MPLSRPGRRETFEQRVESSQRDVRRLRLRTPRHTENFIIDPVSVRALPPAIAIGGRIVGVKIRLGTGGPVTVAMKVRYEDEDTPGSYITKTVHTFTDNAGDGVVRSANVVFDLEENDEFFPDITAGSGGNLSVAFVVAM